jgi:uroporphyrinogen decarboxylase
MLHHFNTLSVDVIGLDWRVALGDAQATLPRKALQGNLDPAVLLAGWDTTRKEVDRILTEIDPKEGYIFNLGHGVPPDADESVLKKLVEYVHER